MQNLDMRVHDSGFSSSGSISFHDHRGTGLHEFHYFLDGEGTFENGGTAHRIHPGMLFFSGPEEAHRAWPQKEGGRFRFYYLLFTTDQDADGLVSEVRARFGGTAAAEVGRGFAGAFEEIRRRCRSREALVRRSADFRLMALLCDLGGRGTGGPASGTGAKYVDEALAVMQASIHDPLDLDTLAARLGIDKAYFVRLFKEAVGLPPMRYFLGLRLDTAKHRLRNGDEGLRAIARDLGFRDEFHFSHQFKAHVGQSPRAYRQSLR